MEKYYSKRFNEDIIVTKDNNFDDGVTKDGNTAIWTSDELLFVKGYSKNILEKINMIKKMFNGKIKNGYN